MKKKQPSELAEEGLSSAGLRGQRSRIRNGREVRRQAQAGLAFRPSPSFCRGSGDKECGEADFQILLRPPEGTPGSHADRAHSERAPLCRGRPATRPVPVSEEPDLGLRVRGRGGSRCSSRRDKSDISLKRSIRFGGRNNRLLWCHAAMSLEREAGRSHQLRCPRPRALGPDPFCALVAIGSA